MLLHKLVNNTYVKCEHENENCFEDYKNGCWVCKDCGYVKPDWHVFTSYNASGSNNGPLWRETKKKSDDNDVPSEYWQGAAYPRYIEAVALIGEVCAANNITRDVLNIASRLLVPQASKLKPTTLPYVSAVAFLEACQQCNVLRTYDEIVRMFKFSKKTFVSYIGKSDQNIIDVSLPSEILPRVPFSPPLAFKHIQRIGEFADAFYEHTDATTSSVLAYAIYFYHKTASRSKGLPKYNMEEVAKLTGVCSTSLKRLSGQHKERLEKEEAEKKKKQNKITKRKANTKQ